MPRLRDKPDGLPARVYERHGTRTYSIGYKRPDGRWEFRRDCPVNDRGRIQELRREAQQRALKLRTPLPAEGTFGALCDAWLAWQGRLPESSEQKRAATTLAENKREIANLKKSFGLMRPEDLVKSDAYGYLDACAAAERPAKGNKEIGLARVILEYGVRIGRLKTNPFDDVEKLKTRVESRLVTDAEIDLALRVGRRLGGPQHIVALALRTAYLCVKRSVEVRALTRDQIGEEGIVWKAAKRQAGEAQRTGLITWSPALRAVVDEALAVKRNKLAGSWYVFGNLGGQKYTKGGWKATLARLMAECVKQAAQERIAFEPFSLQDCRPKGVTRKIERGDTDVVDATLHTSGRMVATVYDRRRMRVATPSE